jgi:hypothetical protein
MVWFLTAIFVFERKKRKIIYVSCVVVVVLMAELSTVRKLYGLIFNSHIKLWNDKNIFCSRLLISCLHKLNTQIGDVGQHCLSTVSVS